MHPGSNRVTGADPEKTLVSVSFEIFGVAKHAPEGSVQKSWGPGGALNPLVGVQGAKPLESYGFHSFRGA